MKTEQKIIKEISDEIERITANRMQLIVQEYFRNILNLPCPDFRENLLDIE